MFTLLEATMCRYIYLFHTVNGLKLLYYYYYNKIKHYDKGFIKSRIYIQFFRNNKLYIYIIHHYLKSSANQRIDDEDWRGEVDARKYCCQQKWHIYIFRNNVKEKKGVTKTSLSMWYINRYKIIYNWEYFLFPIGAPERI